MDVAIGLLATIMLHLGAPLCTARRRRLEWRYLFPTRHALPRSWEISRWCRRSSSFCLRSLLMLGNQSMYQKFFSAKIGDEGCAPCSDWLGRRGDGGTGNNHCCACGLLARCSSPSGEVHQRPREIIAFTALHGLPVGLGALLIGAVFAKIISTANNYLFSPATNLVNDVFIRYILRQTPRTGAFCLSRAW